MNGKLFTFFMFVWSAVLGAVLGTIRNFVAGYAGNEPLPAPAEFLVHDCCSPDINAPHFTFLEIMMITALLLLLPTWRRGGALHRLRAQSCAFMAQTMFAVILALLMLGQFNSYRAPEMLNPPMRPTAIATGIHYFCLGLLAAALLCAACLWANRRRRRHKKTKDQ